MPGCDVLGAELLLFNCYFYSWGLRLMSYSRAGCVPQGFWTCPHLVRRVMSARSANRRSSHTLYIAQHLYRSTRWKDICEHC